jgi:hypothetical protein
MAGPNEDKRATAVQAIESTRSEARHVPVYEIPLDLDDPHKAALEENPERAETLTWRTVCAILVSSVQEIFNVTGCT